MDIQSINRDTIKLRNIAEYEHDIRVLWKEAEETFHEQRLIMDCEPESLVRLMKAAKDFKLLGPFRVRLFLPPKKKRFLAKCLNFQNWFLTHLDSYSSGLQDAYNADFRSNITSVRLKLVDPNPYERRKSRVTLVDVRDFYSKSLYMKLTLNYFLSFLANFG